MITLQYENRGKVYTLPLLLQQNTITKRNVTVELYDALSNMGQRCFRARHSCRRLPAAASSRYAPNSRRSTAVSTAVAASAPAAAAVVPQGIADFSTSVSSSLFRLWAMTPMAAVGRKYSRSVSYTHLTLLTIPDV